MARTIVLVSLVLASALGTAVPAAAQDSARTVAAAQSGRNRDLPLDAARDITIDTDEGSWLSVDVSPDGKTIVFDLLGDLYTIPVAGGEATPVTSGMPFDAQPRFSPGGKFVVFTSDKDGGDNVWTIEVATKALKQIGLGTDLGSLEAGKLADMVVLDANPLENIRNSKTIRYVMKNGRLYDGNMLDEVWPRQKKMDAVPGIPDSSQAPAGIFQGAQAASGTKGKN